MARDAKSLQRSAYAFVAVMLIMGLGTFGYYTWTGTVVHPDGPEFQPYQPHTQTPTTKAKYIPAAALTVEERVKGAPQAVLRLTNNAPIKLTLPDTAAIEPLYAISIKYSSAKDATPVELPRRTQSAPPPRVNFDSNRDAAVSRSWQFVQPCDCVIASVRYAEAGTLRIDGEISAGEPGTHAQYHSSRIQCQWA